LVDPALGPRFAPLRADLSAALGQDNLVVISQRYLAAGMNVRIALKGGGISAMPSMHIATATICVLAARGTRWFWLALLFLLMTFFGSVYLGFHYAVDTPVAAVVALLCWMITGELYATRG
jgi:membrane-associated phospholipid phosphatase